MFVVIFEGFSLIINVILCVDRVLQSVLQITISWFIFSFSFLILGRFLIMTTLVHVIWQWENTREERCLNCIYLTSIEYIWWWISIDVLAHKCLTNELEHWHAPRVVHVYIPFQFAQPKATPSNVDDAILVESVGLYSKSREDMFKILYQLCVLSYVTRGYAYLLFPFIFCFICICSLKIEILIVVDLGWKKIYKYFALSCFFFLFFILGI